ncbi:MAG: SAM-dependent methyltransferase [Acidobacteria bacterium]|nr:MAG: SAM-dependent methyltransferase [Acidobacteriota bacterium]
MDLQPGSERSRFYAEYDWEYRVNTSSATVDWRSRLLGVFHSPYQPTEPALFHEMVAGLRIDFEEFIFVDVGSGKGRTLLMASDYPFRKIIGVELLPELARIAQENIRLYSSPKQRSFDLVSMCGDACEFQFPPEAAVVYLFNPLPKPGLERLIGNLEQSLKEHPRKVFVLYHNAEHEGILAGGQELRSTGGAHQYAVYASRSGAGF